MRACTTGGRPASNQEQAAAKFGTGLFKAVAGFAVDEILEKVKALKSVQITAGIGTAVVSNVSKIVDYKSKADAEQKIRNIKQAEQRLNMNALNPLNEASSTHINPQNRIQIPQLENANPFNKPKETDVQRSQINIVVANKLLNLVQQLSWMQGESNAPLVPQEEGNTSNKNEKEIQKLNKNFIPTQINPQLARNNDQESKMMGSFVGKSKIVSFNENIYQIKEMRPLREQQFGRAKFVLHDLSSQSYISIFNF